MEKILSKSYSMYFTLSYNNTPDYKFCMSLSKKKRFEPSIWNIISVNISNLIPRIIYLIKILI
jgi:hypothetical protein